MKLFSSNAPQIRTPHPGPNTRSHLERIRKVEGQSALTFGLSSETVVAVSARGAAITDVDGNVFLDFVAGFGSLNAGHCHPAVVSALREQADKIHQAMSFGSKTRNRLMEKVISLMPPVVDWKLMLAATGGEAAEIAIKLARRATGRQEVVAFQGAFHGRTMGALSLMGKKAQRQGLGVLVPGAHHVPYPYPYRSAYGNHPEACMEGVLRHIDAFLNNPASGWGEIAAIILEPVQGNGGMIPAPPGFLRAIRERCDQHGVLLIFDEVMSGFCRTGKMFAFEHEADVAPDILVLGKSISGGIPLSACVAKAEIVSASGPGTEGSTYGGNVMGCAAGLASIAVYEKESLAVRAAEQGTYFLKQLRGLAGKYKIIGEARGRGLMVAIELVKDRRSREPLAVAREAVQMALELGLLIYPAGHYSNVLAFLPPLIVSKKEIDIAVSILDEVLSGFETIH